MKKSHLLRALCTCYFALVTSTSNAVLLGATTNGPDGDSTLYEINPLTGTATLLTGANDFKRVFYTFFFSWENFTKCKQMSCALLIHF